MFAVERSLRHCVWIDAEANLSRCLVSARSSGSLQLSRPAWPQSPDEYRSHWEHAMTTNATPEPEQRPNRRFRWIPRLRWPIVAVGVGGALAGGLITAAVITGTGAAAAPASYFRSGTPVAGQSSATPEQPLTAACRPHRGHHGRRLAPRAPGGAATPLAPGQPAPPPGAPAPPPPGQPAPPPPPPGG